MVQETINMKGAMLVCLTTDQPWTREERQDDG